VTADLTEPLGAEVLVYFGTEATRVVSSAAAADAGEDAEVQLRADEEGEPTSHLVARVSPRTRVAVGQPIELAVDTSRLYFFDPETRDAI
jgi:multiple sugar transport system ATP-binding protein